MVCKKIHGLITHEQPVGVCVNKTVNDKDFIVMLYSTCNKHR